MVLERKMQGLFWLLSCDYLEQNIEALLEKFWKKKNILMSSRRFFLLLEAKMSLAFFKTEASEKD